ncbi:hypothetical protein EcWSU1_A029 (plasmid) [Enterobacter ludwigii]|uniref:Uncharacterized protein n=1 Tax=Enterobacter ludwigii TaxID=299767 RepID=G8LQA7_9ENTR|nr:hypothetical protein EcWSU1_A029 [Enterobacter ludwigii]
MLCFCAAARLWVLKDPELRVFGSEEKLERIIAV